MHTDAGHAYPCLVADIGGTNARFGWVSAKGLGVESVSKLPVADHSGVGAAAEAYLLALKLEQGSRYQSPRRAAIAVATAIVGDQVEMTNSGWSFSQSALQRRLGLDALRVLNDFEALALSLPHLGPGQLRAHGALPTPHGTLAVLGPGTGLGVAAVVRTPAGWTALPGEGGHATLAPGDDFEFELLRQVRHEHEHVSAERLLSGIGLPSLHQAVAAVLGQRAGPLSTRSIVAAGVDGSDPLCWRTLEVFCALLGRFAGNVALILGARGGVYIGGGIVPRMQDLFFASRFRECFESKGRFRPYLEAIPTALITDTLAALGGAAAALDSGDRSGPPA